MQRPLAYPEPNEPPNRLQSLKDFALNYLKNRSDFYAVLLPRIPDEGQRGLLGAAVQPVRTDEQVIGSLDQLIGEPDEFLRAFGLRDMLKKPGFGTAWGRTTISFEEALARSGIVEETGLILFESLAALCPSWADVLVEQVRLRKSALAALLRLDDDLRYHKLTL